MRLAGSGTKLILQTRAPLDACCHVGPPPQRCRYHTRHCTHDCTYLAQNVDDSCVTAGGSLTGEQATQHPQQDHEPGGRLLSSSSEHGEATQPADSVNLVGSPNGGSPLQATPVPRQVLPHPTSPNKQPPTQLQLQDPGHCSGSAQHSPWSMTPSPLHQPVLQVSPDPVQSCLETVLSDRRMVNTDMQLLLLLSLCPSVFDFLLLLSAISEHEP